MRIREVSQRSGVAPTRIRFYEARGLLPKPARSGNGYRVYPASVVAALNLIDQAQSLGFTLKEIRAALVQSGDDQPSKPEMLVALRHKLVAIDRHLEDVTARRERIVALITKFEGRF